MTPRQRSAHRVLVTLARYQTRHGWPTKPREGAFLVDLKSHKAGKA